MVDPIARRVPVEEYNNAKAKKYGISKEAAAALNTTNDLHQLTDSYISTFEMNDESQPSPVVARELVIATRPRRGLPARKRNNRNNSTSNVDEADSDSDSDLEGGGENNMSFTSLSRNHLKRGRALTKKSCCELSESDEESDDSDEECTTNHTKKKQAPRKVSL